jgi:hypothetical protein
LSSTSALSPQTLKNPIENRDLQLSSHPLEALKFINLRSVTNSIAKPTQKELGIKFGIGKTTVSDILKRKSEYTQLFEENTTSQ